MGVIAAGLGLVGMPSAGRLDAQAAQKKEGPSKLTPADFSKLLTLIKPHPDESPWAEIPWMTDLYAARKKAAAEGKPLYVWSASADALGCT
jgi:hypothetical protein